MTVKPEPKPKPDLLAIEFIRQGTHMRLSDVDLPAAVRILAPTLTATQIAKRCGYPEHVVVRTAKRLGIKTKAAHNRRPARQSLAA